MKASILTIGDELLIGRTENSNATWLGEQLTLQGIDVREVDTISDRHEAIVDALDRLRQQSFLLIITGGLGPTKDDLTKKTLASYFNVSLTFREDVYERFRKLFAERSPEFLKRNTHIAELPENAELIENRRGTAQGMWIEDGGNLFVVFPGVPHEMKALTEKGFLPRLRERYALPVIRYRYIHTAGIGESRLAEILDSFENKLPGYMELAYQAGLGEVRLRLTGRGEDGEAIDQELKDKVSELSSLLGDLIYGYDGKDLEVAVGDALKEKGAVLATGESCTGGYVANSIISVPGSSDYMTGSIVAYENRIKQQMLNVSSDTLKQHGAVSEETVREMVAGLIANWGVDYAIATSGIAGPSGGTDEKPVGTVWIAAGTENDIRTKKLYYPAVRVEVIRISSSLALHLLYRHLVGSKD